MKRLMELYTMLYEWHKKVGKTLIEKFPRKIDDDYYKSYLKFLETMPHPKDADLNYIRKTAWQQISGFLEWSYREEYNDIPLNEIAREIIEILDKTDKK